MQLRDMIRKAGKFHLPEVLGQDHEKKNRKYYPYNLKLSLQKEDLENLKINTNDFKPDDNVVIVAKSKVFRIISTINDDTMINGNDFKYEDNKELCLQITDMNIFKSDEKNVDKTLRNAVLLKK